MTTNSVDCAEIRSGFVSGRVPEGVAVDEHLKGCPSCRELFERDAQLGRSLAAVVVPTMDPGDLLARIDRDLARDVGVRARFRALPTWIRAGALVLIGMAPPALQLLLRPRADFGDYSPPVFWGLALLLILLLSYGSLRLMRGLGAPLQVGSQQPLRTLVLVLVPAAVAFISPLGAATHGSDPQHSQAETLGAITMPSRSGSADQSSAIPSAWGGAASSSFSDWGHPAACFGYGALLVIPFIVLMWLFERREHVPLVVAASGGALAGIAANLLLHAHCPSSHLGHLLLGHASIGGAWALALALFFRRNERFA